jgi:DNA repair protein RadC
MHVSVLIWTGAKTLLLEWTLQLGFSIRLCTGESKLKISSPMNTSQQLTKPITQIAEITASYKRNLQIPLHKVRQSNDAVQVLRCVFPVQIEYREAMIALFLNRSNVTVGFTTLSIGGMASTVCDIRLLFQTAILCHCTGFILCHNHPSGNLKPSKADISLTTRVIQAGELLDITLLDHIILSNASHYSFADNGLI